jgi:HEAT repeat protein
MDFEAWKTLLQSDEPLDRCDAIEDFPEAEDAEEIFPFILAALDDPDDMVRVSACEILGLFPYEPVRKKLNSHWEKESNDLVKEYCIRSLGMVGTIDDYIYILNIIKTTKNQRIKSFAISGLIEGMQFELFPILIEHLTNQDYDLKLSLGYLSANSIQKILTTFKMSLSEAEKGLEQCLKVKNYDGDRETFQDTLKLVRKGLKSFE